MIDEDRPRPLEGDGDGRLTRRGLIAGALVLALPARALAGGSAALPAAGSSGGRSGAPHSVDVPLGGMGGTQGVRVVPAFAVPPFTMVGLHWRGSGRVWVRVAAGPGRFGPWHKVDCCERPDEGPEATLSGWSLGKPVWTGRADRIQLRLSGAVKAVRAHSILSEPLATRRLAVAGTPGIIPRAGWRAREQLVRSAPWETEHLQLAIVHHTAGENPASPQESIAIIRAIQQYHVNANGWNDIGYNFLVDPFGQIFEGRGGGVERNIVGAHARGFNAGAVGIALLGNYEQQPLTPEARDALVRLLAWRLDVGHLDPQTLPSIVSGGTSRHGAGAPVTLRAVSGHRDTDLTVCPGASLYPEIGSVAAEAAALGLPKLYEPRAQGRLGEPVRVTGRLSEDRPWRVAITDPTGTTVHEAAGTGTAIETTWDATGIDEGPFAYSISAGEAVRGATGSVRAAEPPAAPEPPPRPKGVPRRVPRWAFDLYVWHNKPRGQRGPRPRGAPRRPPRWYWRWRKWRLARARFYNELAQTEAAAT